MALGDVLLGILMLLLVVSMFRGGGGASNTCRPRVGRKTEPEEEA